jgi:hypothetical protein
MWQQQQQQQQRIHMHECGQSEESRSGLDRSRRIWMKKTRHTIAESLEPNIRMKKFLNISTFF